VDRDKELSKGCGLEEGRKRIEDWLKGRE